MTHDYDLAWTARPDAGERTRALKRRSHELIPGGTHTYAKGDDQYPVTAPSFLVRGSGARVWDSDGNEYIEYGGGMRAVTLGHAHPAVVDAVTAAAARGTNFVRPDVMEVEAAERLLAFLGWGDAMAKFAKNGSDVTSAAVRLARAATGRNIVAVCSDQPLFSHDDWFIGTTSMSAGVPAAVRALTVGFPYGDADALNRLLAEHGGRVAAVILEAAKYDDPPEGYLQAVRDSCDRHGCVLIFDEMITGFRWPTGSAAGHYGVTPDLATFGKGLGNGFSVAALVGRRDLMALGGLHSSAPRVYLLSSTHGGDATGLAAAIAVMDTYEREKVLATLWDRGSALAAEVTRVAEQRNLSDSFQVIGPPYNLAFVVRDPDGNASQEYRTLFLQELIARGVIGPSFVISAAHGHLEIERTVEAVDAALQVHAKAMSDGVGQYLRGRPSKPVFRRWV